MKIHFVMNGGGGVETIEHYFFSCEHVKAFWRQLEIELYKYLPTREKLTFTCTTVLFGASQISNVVNFIVLLAKQFIAQQRYQDTEIGTEIFGDVGM